MILILLSWFYMFFISIGMGSILFSFGNFKRLPFLIVSGLFFQLLLIQFWALFLPVNPVFYGINSIISIALIYYNNSRLSELATQTLKDFKEWNPFLKIFFGLISLLALMQSSVSPYLPDNESYYIQSIKWLNEYGLVKGLANLHLFFGQMSGWHLLQSSFNFGFWFDFLNDINGFFLIVISFFSFNRLNAFFRNREFIDLFAGLILISAIFLFRFLDAPSPDLPVFLLFPCMVWLFYSKFNQPTKESVIMLFIFGLLLTLIKVTAFPVLILAFILMFKAENFRNLLVFAFIICGISLIAFFSKNYIITGYILNPTDIFSNWFNPDWKVPTEVHQLFYDYTQFHAFNSPSNEFNDFENWSQLTKFERWFFSPKLHGFFNKLIILLLLVFPFFIRKSKALFWIYLTALIQFIILYFGSPQYRFFFHIILVLSLLILSKLMFQTKINNIKILLGSSIVPILFPLLFSFNFSFLSTNDFMKTNSKTFQVYYLIKPHKNAQYEYPYEIIKIGNLEYHSPIKTYMWLSGDGSLPTANKLMIDFIKDQKDVIPQLRTGKLKDGFYGQNIEK